MAKLLLTLTVLFPLVVAASPLAAPGDVQLRHDLLLLSDSGVIDVPLTAWPIVAGDIHAALADVDRRELNSPIGLAVQRVEERLRSDPEVGSLNVRVGISGAYRPRIIRAFEYSPREEGEATIDIDLPGERVSMTLSAAYTANPFDEDRFRPDGTYIGLALGNWMVTAGWQERWWGPGRDGSLIFSTNARPMPGLAIQRNNSTRFESKWLGWMGPWTLISFMDLLDDERVVNDGWLFGLRGSFRPARGVEVGISRTAQWCGDGRPCDLSTFLRLLNGNDNRGANVDPEDEPGNQLGGIDIRWVLPRDVPLAIYMQWIAEDTRRTGAQLHLWMKQLGVEHWGTVGDASHRTHFEFVNSNSHLGALGEGSAVANVAYNHSIFQSGYRYQGRSIGFSGDGDTLSYSIGSTLVQSAGHTWNISLRHMEINRSGAPDLRHSLAPTPRHLTDLQISHERLTKFGRVYAGLGYERFDDRAANTSDSDASAFLQWSSN